MHDRNLTLTDNGDRLAITGKNDTTVLKASSLKAVFMWDSNSQSRRFLFDCLLS